MTTHATNPDPAPARRSSAWWALFLFTMFGLLIPALLVLAARWLLSG